MGDATVTRHVVEHPAPPQRRDLRGVAAERPKSPRCCWADPPFQRSSVRSSCARERRCGLRCGSCPSRARSCSRGPPRCRAPGLSPAARMPCGVRRRAPRSLDGRGRAACAESGPRQRQDPARAHERGRGQHLRRARHGGQPLQRAASSSGAASSRACTSSGLMRSSECRALPSELTRAAARLDPLGKDPDHRLQEGERVLHDVGLAPAALLVHVDEPLTSSVSAASAPCSRSHSPTMARSAPGASGCTRGPPTTPRSPTASRVGIGALGVVGHGGDAHGLARLRVEHERPVERALHVAK